MTAATRVGIAVPAAGAGRRMGGRKKPFLELAGEPVLLRSLRPLLSDPRTTCVAVALAAEDAADPPEWLPGLDERIRIVEGGAPRGASVA
ncbi:MAG: 2-C-methyl-D-erythritol 4-phosphate cytidylyltransferase, partial [Longimicrobiales bacterium]|nr:2-C-methyl-D-erythritol 4-phosphate cytidylyltransferase [Longimicrobiales bacterium]